MDIQEQLKGRLLELIGQRPTEAIAVAFIKGDKVLAVEVMATGDGTSVTIDNRCIESRARILGANKVIISHNHPKYGEDIGGDPATPSFEDVLTTVNTAGWLAQRGIYLEDHLVVGQTTVCSIRHGVLL